MTVGSITTQVGATFRELGAIEVDSESLNGCRATSKYVVFGYAGGVSAFWDFEKDLVAIWKTGVDFDRVWRTQLAGLHHDISANATE